MPSSTAAGVQLCHRAPGATWATIAGNGLGSATDLGGSSCLAALGYACAFGGINPSAPPLSFLSPVGRSTYDGLQMKWTYNTKAPFKGTTGLNFTASYSLSSFQNTRRRRGPGWQRDGGQRRPGFHHPVARTTLTSTATSGLPHWTAPTRYPSVATWTSATGFRLA